MKILRFCGSSIWWSLLVLPVLLYFRAALNAGLVLGLESFDIVVLVPLQCRLELNINLRRTFTGKCFCLFLCLSSLLTWCLYVSSVYVMLSCTFRYGRQDMDVMGVAFRRDLFLVTRQVYPELQDKEKLTHTKVQQKLLRKLGDNAFPFFFEVRRWDKNKKTKKHTCTYFPPPSQVQVSNRHLSTHLNRPLNTHLNKHWTNKRMMIYQIQ